MQPDTSRRITLSRNLLVALTSFRISRPIRSHRVRAAGRPDLNSPMAETDPVSGSNSLSLLLAMTLLAALIGCGPAPSEEVSRKESGTGIAPGLSSAGTVTRLGAEPVPLSSAASSTPRASTMQSLPDTRDQPTTLPEHLVLPESILKELESPDASVRLRALDHWAQQGPKASLDPLVVALDDEDEVVRAKAMAIIEQQSAIEPEREEVSGEQ
ncbi:MAG: HEAT repeat domain-containing protein [Nitrospira sp.]|nr:HEAT repeat domain-containing protein [Nitrospira sp.]